MIFQKSNGIVRCIDFLFKRCTLKIDRFPNKYLFTYIPIRVARVTLCLLLSMTCIFFFPFSILTGNLVTAIPYHKSSIYIHIRVHMIFCWVPFILYTTHGGRAWVFRTYTSVRVLTTCVVGHWRRNDFAQTIPQRLNVVQRRPSRLSVF